MATKVLVIDGDDQGHFFLAVEGQTVTIGDSPAHAEAVLRNLHIKRIHCEFEVEEEAVVVRAPAGAGGAATGESGLDQELIPGEAVRVGHAHLRLEAAPAGGNTELALPTLDDDLPRLADEEPARGSAPPAAAASAEPAPASGVRKQLRVIDGADQGRSFFLPEAGSACVGKSSKHADIILHDLYVARVHCELKVQGDRVLVTHHEGQNGTLINGVRITEPKELALGDVLRVGNSHLQLEIAVVGGPGQSAPDEDGQDIPEVEPEVLEESSAAGGPGETAADVVELEVADEDSKSQKKTFQLPHSPIDRLIELEDQVLAHYQIGRLLGRGQSGVVFLAQDKNAQDRKTNHAVTLKVLSPDFPASGAELQHFVQALKVTPQLQHANLVALQGVGKSGPYCWLAREYIEGESVARLVKRQRDEGQFKWARAGRVAVHLGRVLAFLHQHKVIHGNITPRNVLIRSSDKLTKLADLMLAEALRGSQLQEAIFDKKRLAELPYLAPEQVDADAPVDHLADLYGLGALVYALLTGQPPFAGDSTDDIMAQMRKGKVVKPSRFQRGIPGSFEAAVLRLLAKRPEDRYPSAANLLADVEPIAREHEIKV